MKHLSGQIIKQEHISGDVGIVYGRQGRSAYEIAVLHGFVGTEEEWLESLRGQTGAVGPQGEEGEKGDKGDTGEKGDKGETGPQGIPGEKGEKGNTGDTGPQGLPGQDAPQIKDDEATAVNPYSGAKTQSLVDLLTVIKADVIVADAEGEQITLHDSNGGPLKSLTVYGKSTQDGTPRADAPVQIVSAGDGGSMVITVSDGGQNTVTIPIVTGLPLRHTRRSVKGAVSDVYDTLEIFADGTGVITKRSEFVIVSHADVYFSKVVGDVATFYVPVDKTYPVAGTGIYNMGLSNRFICNGITGIGHCYFGGASSRKVVFFYMHTDTASTVEQMQAIMTQWEAEGEPLALLYPLENPETIPLSAEEVQAALALQSCKGVTGISNDAGAHMKAKYIADTKAYIDNKFARLETAVLSLGANI